MTEKKQKGELYQKLTKETVTEGEDKQIRAILDEAKAEFPDSRDYMEIVDSNGQILRANNYIYAVESWKSKWLDGVILG